MEFELKDWSFVSVPANPRCVIDRYRDSFPPSGEINVPMTFHEWINGQDPIVLWERHRSFLTRRKKRLGTVRFAKSLGVYSGSLRQESFVIITDWMEDYADGGKHLPDNRHSYWVALENVDHAIHQAIVVYNGDRTSFALAVLRDLTGESHSRYSRQHFDDPLRPFRTPTVVQLAEDIYERKAWDLMPILADLLIDSGLPEYHGIRPEPATRYQWNTCDLIMHLRGFVPLPDGTYGPRTIPFFRGCWSLDLCLGKPYKDEG